MPTLHDHARIMRRQSTPAERTLWRALRAKQVNGGKWRRQYPVGSYIIDLYCLRLGLAVEIDGESHVDNSADQVRDAWLLSQGICTLRFWNNDVLGNTSGVLERIAAHPCPRPPPTRGGGDSGVPTGSP